MRKLILAFILFPHFSMNSDRASRIQCATAKVIDSLAVASNIWPTLKVLIVRQTFDIYYRPQI